MSYANLQSGGGRRVSAYVSSGTWSESPRGPDSSGKTWQAVGVLRGRSCFLSSFALFCPWAIAAK